MAGKKGQKLTKKHEDSPRFAEYYKKNNPELSNKQCEEKAKWFRKSCNYLAKEYYERNYPDLSNEEREKLRQKNLKKSRENNKNHFEYWKKNYPELSKEEQEKLWHDFAKTTNYCCVEYYLARGYSKEEAIKERDNRVKKMGNKVSEKLMGENNPMHSSKTTQEERNSISPRNIAFYERKYPELSHEEHLKLQQEFFEKNRKAIKNAIKDTNIEYYLNQGMSKEEAEQALKKRQATFTLEKCIKKYGEIEGLKKFSERQQKWLKSLQQNFSKFGDGRGQQSEIANDLIQKCCKILNIRKPYKEKYIYDNIFKRAYSYDFVYNNKIIEFQGDYWHCNPELYNEDFYNKVKKKTAKEIWQFDKEKKECAEKYGYKILYIWEYEYKQDKDATIKKCIDFLTNDKEMDNK